MSASLVIRNIGQLLTMNPNSGGKGDGNADPVAGLGIIFDGAIAIEDEQILFAGKDDALAEAVSLTADTQVIDAGGCAALPGLIDCHTHLVFAGSRAHEFSRRISGATYEEILAAGGGIHSTVKATREASQEVLVAQALQRLHASLTCGVTTIEVKSGYGLNLETEIKMLKAIAQTSRQHPIDLVPTFLGAHTLPMDLRSEREKYLDIVINEMLPAVAEQKLARFCDVFCEQGAFSLEETRRVLEAGLEHGLKPKLHSEQLSRSGSIKLAVELGAVSVDHLEKIDTDDAQVLAASDTVAVLLPGATYFLGKTDFAPGRILADCGCALAVSSDFNPGSCMSQNLPLMLNMACIYSGIYPREALLGATRFAAQAIDSQDRIGSLMPGMQADILILNTPDYRNLVYHFGVPHTQMVIKRGKKVLPSN
jgi:imidazolonepropionase